MTDPLTAAELQHLSRSSVERQRRGDSTSADLLHALIPDGEPIPVPTLEAASEFLTTSDMAAIQSKANTRLMRAAVLRSRLRRWARFNMPTEKEALR